MLCSWPRRDTLAGWILQLNTSYHHLNTSYHHPLVWDSEELWITLDSYACRHAAIFSSTHHDVMSLCRCHSPRLYHLVGVFTKFPHNSNSETKTRVPTLVWLSVIGLTCFPVENRPWDLSSTLFRLCFWMSTLYVQNFEKEWTLLSNGF